MRVPVAMCGGTLVLTPLESIAGFTTNSGLALHRRIGLDHFQRHPLGQLDGDRHAVVEAEANRHVLLEVGRLVADDVLRHGDLLEILAVHEGVALYQDGEGYTFMNGENFEQVTVPASVIGDQAAYLQENMTVHLSLYNGVPIAIELPQRVTLEVTETEPAMKGQTAASSYKPAMLSNGVRTNVPPHIAPGTRIVVMTADGSYVERAKD